MEGGGSYFVFLHNEHGLLEEQLVRYDVILEEVLA